jgi:hypothetical protein
MDRIPNSYYEIPYIDIENFEFDDTVNLISRSFALKNNVIPMEQYDNHVTVCMGIPNIELYNKLGTKTKKQITIFKGDPNKIKKLIKMLYREKITI